MRPCNAICPGSAWRMRQRLHRLPCATCSITPVAYRQRVGIEHALHGDRRPDALEARVRELKARATQSPGRCIL